MLETGPVLIRHERRWTEDGKKQRCRHEFVAVPSQETGRVEMHKVTSRSQADAVLRNESEKWLAHRARQVSRALRQATAVQDIYGVTL